jgi:hypothetical protein
LSLRVIGAGLGRTGTTSLREALSIVLGGRCYHFEDVIATPAHVPLWRAAIRGEAFQWERIYDGYVATTDWPGASFWQELQDTYPDSFILLSYRKSSAEWFESVKDTIEALLTRTSESPEDDWHLMAQELLKDHFVPVPFDRREAEQAYERHNALVRATVSPSRLIQWTPGDGWEPICRGLDVDVPGVPFPHLNTKTEFRASLAKAAGESVKLPAEPGRRDLARSLIRRMRPPRER